jgi:UDP-GlcNAc:undecaprenyl-phosphate GlcNAc-1-phosphate transferase
MMHANGLVLLFAVSFLGCVLSTPLVTRLAGWIGAIDRPDQYRRIHQGAIPRLGGLAVACGLALTWILFQAVYQAGIPLNLGVWTGTRQGAIALATLVILMVGVVDDARGLPPRVKLLGQALAVLVLYWGDIRIERLGFMNTSIELSWPATFEAVGRSWTIDAPSLLATLLWFLGCMNIWNLIDGMDGLAAGVGLLVTGTLMLVALYQENAGSVVLAVALAGSLTGFLLYNWHPACIFLGDTGALLVGMLIGVIGVQDSLKGPSAVSILFPILAMGLPISDTAMAIFRRWVRDLPMTAADRQHVHHILIGLGLGPRRAAAVLYLMTAGLCGVVLLGVAWNNEVLALILGLSGCLAFLLILTSRRDELAQLRDDFRARLRRGRQERGAVKLTWEAIQRIQLAQDERAVWRIAREATAELGGELHGGVGEMAWEGNRGEARGGGISELEARLRLRSKGGTELEAVLWLGERRPWDTDVVVRSVDRLARAMLARVELLRGVHGAGAAREPGMVAEGCRAETEGITGGAVQGWPVATSQSGS